MNCALDVQSSLTTTGHLPDSALELLSAKITTSASWLEAHLQVASVQFPENHDIVEQSACRVFQPSR
jgi:hypothetical protein